MDKMAEWLMEVCDIRWKEAGKICDALERMVENCWSSPMPSPSKMGSNEFISTPLQDCEITDVPGLEHRAVEKLKEANIDTAEKLIVQYLILGRDVDTMADWLMEVCDIRSKEAGKICDVLDRKAEKTASLKDMDLDMALLGKDFIVLCHL